MCNFLKCLSISVAWKLLERQVLWREKEKNQDDNIPPLMARKKGREVE